MPNEENTDFEITKELDSFNDLNNQIVEVQEQKPEETLEPLESEKNPEEFFTPPKKEKLPAKIKKWWKKLNKKQRILVISGLSVLAILLIVGLVFLILHFVKKDEPSYVPEVIVQEENYRYENGVLVFLNSNKEELGRYTCVNQSENLCFVAYYSTEDDFDVEQKVYENGEKVKTRSSIIGDTYVFIQDNPRESDTEVKLYNIKEQKADTKYQLVKKVDANKVILKNENGLYGVMNIDANSITTNIDFTYNYLGFIPNDKNYYVAIQNEQNYILDASGKIVSKAISGTIKNFTDTYVKVKDTSGKYVVYNYNNQNIFNESYDYVELRNDYAVLINDNKMNLKFYDKNKLNEDAFNLSNTSYVKTNVYDKANTLKETKECFSLEENNNIITLTIKKGNDSSYEVINKAEGLLNKDLRNLSYFNGKLYIYSDIEKNTLLGSYTCANKNNVDSGSMAFTNCTLAQDTIYEDNDYETPGTSGVIPVFNERFVFISDNPDLVNESNATVVLYDLKTSTTLGKYRTVNTYSYTGTKDITFSTVTDLQVVAKNQSGNFGVIKINLAEVKGHIGFNYSEMEKLRDYYVAKDANGYLLISKSNGASVTSAIPYKIRNYTNNYVKVINNGNYYIYDYKGKQINRTGYRYIELYDKYFAGVDTNNKLGVFAYDRPESNILSGRELIPLNLTKYYGNGTLAFKISGTEVFIGNADNTYTVASSQIIMPEEED